MRTGTTLLERIDAGLRTIQVMTLGMMRLEKRVVQLEKLVGIEEAEGKPTAHAEPRARRKYQRKRTRVANTRGQEIRAQILHELNKGARNLKHLRKATGCRLAQLSAYLTRLHAEGHIARAKETGRGYWRLPRKNETVEAVKGNG